MQQARKDQGCNSITPQNITHSLHYGKNVSCVKKRRQHWKIISLSIFTETYNFLHGPFLTPQKSGDEQNKKILACKGGKAKNVRGGFTDKMGGKNINAITFAF